jgi:Leucine Rich repeat
MVRQIASGSDGDAAGDRLPRLPAVGDNAAMQTEPLKADPPKRRRRWFQFSLRTLMIVVLIAAIPCAWLRSKIEQKRQERQTVEAILKSGGDVKYDYQTASPPATAPGLGWLRSMLGEDFFSEVVSVSIYDDFFKQLLWPNAADSQLTRIKDLSHLESLYLSRTNTTDAGLENIKNLTKLKDLNLDETDITDAGMTNLKGLMHVKSLSLALLKITDAGLANLEGMTELESLMLYKTSGVTDAGLVHLKGLKQLKAVDLNGTSVTSAGIRDLRKALPNCEVFR